MWFQKRFFLKRALIASKGIGRRLLALSLLCAMGFFAYRMFPKATPLTISFWYWHHPFSLSSSEITQLTAMGVHQLFVHAGTFKASEGKVHLVLPQTWISRSTSLGVHLVFSFDYDVVHRFGTLPNKDFAILINRFVQNELTRAEREKMKIRGLQLDFDCPTRLLPKYAELLKKLRPLLLAHHPSIVFSITALPTWFTSKDLRGVIEVVDFYVPQFYESRFPKSLDGFATVSNLRMVGKGLQTAKRLRRPFYTGFPAYGRCLLYNKQGKLQGLCNDLGLYDVIRHPTFQLDRAFPSDRNGKPAQRSAYIGEDLYDFIAREPTPDGQGKGYHLLYDVPTPELIAQHLDLLRSKGPRNCQGVLFFRFPESGEAMTLPLSAFASACRGEKPLPQLKVHLVSEHRPWEIIDTQHVVDRAPLDLTVTVTNVGASNTSFTHDAVLLKLFFDRPGFDQVDAGDFDQVETYFSDPVDRQSSAERVLLRSGLHRTNVLCLTKWYLAAGGTAKTGPIRINTHGPTRLVQGAWSAKRPGGFERISGRIKEMNLSVEK